MGDERTTTFNGYFSARGVAPDAYNNYTLPLHLVNVLPSDRTSPILDIGCGYGQMLMAMRDMGFSSLRGVDMSDEAVAYSRAAGLEVSLIADLRAFIRGSAKQYELVLMNHVVEHVDKDQIIETLKLIRSRLLSPTGALYLATPNAQSSTDCYWAYEDFTHTTMLTGGSLIYVLRRAGYEGITFLDPAGRNTSRTRKGLQGEAFKRSIVPTGTFGTE